MDQQKPLPRLLALLFFLSCLLLPLGAVPSSRSLALRNQAAPALEAAEVISRGERVLMEELVGRMDIERELDYPGSSANNRHDPRSPGRA